MTYGEFAKRTLTVLGLLAFALMLWELRGIVMLVLLASIIAVSLNLPVQRLQKWGMRRQIAIALTLAGVVVGLGLFLAWILPAMVVELAQLIAQLPDAWNTFQAAYTDWYAAQSGVLTDFLPELDGDVLDDVLAQVADAGSALLPGAGTLLLNGLGNFLIVIVVSVFLLLDPMDYLRGFITLVPAGLRGRALEVMLELRLAVTTWMTALSFSITITIILVWLVLGVILGIPNALGLGVIAGLMTIIPTIGSIVPVIPIIIFTLSDDPAKLPLSVPAYIIIQLVESNILTPAYVKRQLNIPVALVLLFQVIAGTLFGLIGVLLAVPMLAIIITLVRELYVYDALGMRGTSFDIEQDQTGQLRIVTREADSQHTSLVTGVRSTSLVSPIRRTTVVSQVNLDEMTYPENERPQGPDDT